MRTKIGLRINFPGMPQTWPVENPLTHLDTPDHTSYLAVGVSLVQLPWKRRQEPRNGTKIDTKIRRDRFLAVIITSRGLGFTNRIG